MDTILSRNSYLKSSEGCNSESINTRLMVLALCTSPMLVNICMKFHEDILNGFQVTEWTWFCDRQTDGWTDRQTDDPGKNNMSPNPKVGRHNSYVWSRTTLNSAPYCQACPHLQSEQTGLHKQSRPRSNCSRSGSILFSISSASSGRIIVMVQILG